MMYKNKKGFSLAELLISLLIISIILAAAIPTVTKRNKYDPETTWQWSGRNNSAYFGVGSDQSAVIGYFKVPSYSDRKSYYDENVFDLDTLDSSHPLRNGDDTNNPAFTTVGDKLNLVKRFPFSENVEYNFRNSHISFYNIRGNNATENDIKYAGRIAADEYNIAFGIGTLASLRAIDYSDVKDKYNHEDTFKGYNTAIGHYSSILTSDGQYNTALGFSALRNSTNGDNNTAIGVETLSTGTSGKGNNNTAVGAYALKNANDGNNNTAIGSGACNNLIGNGNICIGYAAGTYSGASTTTVNNSLIIGYGEEVEDDNNKSNGAPLITGVLDQTDGDEDNPLFPTTDPNIEKLHKQLNVNALKFKVNPFDGSVPIFEVVAKSGLTGYEAKKAKFGDFNFTLRDTYGGTDAAQSIQVQMYDGGYISPNSTLLKKDKLVKVDVVDHYNLPKDNTNATHGNLLLSETFYFITPKSVKETPSDAYAHINIHNFSDDVPEKKVLGLIDETVLLQHKDASGVYVEMTKDNGFRLRDTSNKYTIKLKKDDGILISDNPVLADASSFIKLDTGLKMNSASGKVIFASSTSTWDPPVTIIANGQGDIEMPSLSNVQFNGTTLSTDGSLYEILTTLPSTIKSYVDSQIDAIRTSDIRLKNVSGDSTAGLKEINALEVKNYTYKNDKNKTPHVGVIAQQLQKIFPNSVFEGEDGYLRIRTEEIFYAMVNSIKELFTQIQDLTAKVVGLDKRLTELEKENALLKKQNEDFEKRLSKLEAKMAK